MQALTNLDTSFLHQESDRTPLHVGGVMLFAAPAQGVMSFERFRSHVAARLQTARVFRQRHLPADIWQAETLPTWDATLRRRAAELTQVPAHARAPNCRRKQAQHRLVTSFWFLWERLQPRWD